MRVWGKYDGVEVTVRGMGGFPLEAGPLVTDVASSESCILSERRHR